MKKCALCNRVYDDSWGVCLGCNEKLVAFGEGDTIPAFINEAGLIKRCGIDVLKLKISIAKLKRDLIIFFIFLALFLASTGIIKISNIPLIIMGILCFVYAVIVHYRLFRMMQEMKEGNIRYFAWIAGLGIAFTMLANAKDVLKALEEKP